MRTIEIAVIALLAAAPAAAFAAQPPSSSGVAVPQNELPPEPKDSGGQINSAFDADTPKECYVAAVNRSCGLGGQMAVDMQCGCRFPNLKAPMSLGRTR